MNLTFRIQFNKQSDSIKAKVFVTRATCSRPSLGFARGLAFQSMNLSSLSQTCKLALKSDIGFTMGKSNMANFAFSALR